MGVVVGAPAEVGQHPAAQAASEGFGAQCDSGGLQLVGSVAADQQLDLHAGRRAWPRGRRRAPRRRPSPRDRAGVDHALGNRAPVRLRRRVDADAHHRGSHGRQPIQRRRARSTVMTSQRVGHRADRRRMARHRASPAAADGRPEDSRSTATRRLPAARRPRRVARRGRAQPVCSGAAARRSRSPSSCARCATAGRRGRDTVVIANGEEGEPASIKDRWLLRQPPAPGARRSCGWRPRSSAPARPTSTCPTPGGRRRRRGAGRTRRAAALDGSVDKRGDGRTELRRRRGDRRGSGDQRRPGQADRQAAAPVRGGRRRPAHTGEQRRDAGQPAVPAAARRRRLPRRTGTSDSPGTFLATITGAGRPPALYEIPHGVAVADLLDPARGFRRRGDAAC